MYRLFRIIKLFPPRFWGSWVSPAPVEAVQVDSPEMCVRMPQEPLMLIGVPMKEGAEFLCRGKGGNFVTESALKVVLNRNPDMWKAR